MMRSYLAAVGTVIMAFLVSHAGASTKQAGMQLVNEEVKKSTIPKPDQDLLACQAARKAYNEHHCDKSENVTGECKDITSDLKDCEPYK